MANVRENESSRMRWPIFQGILPVEKSQIPKDVLAGITLAALAVPEVMGYTRISGTPVITGLFTILLPMALYAFFGSSRHLVVGADSATAAVLAAGLVGIAAVGSPEYVAYAGVLALMAAGMLIVARLVRLGFLADFLSRTVLIGFLTGVGIEVAIKQSPDMLEIQGARYRSWLVLMRLLTSNPCDFADSVNWENNSSSMCGVLLNIQRYLRFGVPTTAYS